MSGNIRSLFATAKFQPRTMAKIARLDLATGKLERVREIGRDEVGTNLWDLHLARDGRAYAYSQGRTYSKLFLVRGLH